MVVAALRGALGFLSRLPVGSDERDWEAFRSTPAALPVAGYAIGALLVLPMLLPIPAPTVAFLFVVWCYLVTGIAHADGVTDLGDALAVHAGPETRRSAMRDTAVGAGGALVLTVVLLGLATAALALAAAPLRAVPLVIAAEVGAKAGMAAVVCLGSPAHEGLGSAVAGSLEPRSFVLPALLAVPAALLAWPRPTALVVLVTGVAAALTVLWWARRSLGGVSGDVIGASNEVARVVGLHAGVIAWTRF